MTPPFSPSLVGPSRWSWAASLLLLLAVRSVAAPPSPPATTDPVRAVAERNIFNPARTPPSNGIETAPNTPPSPVAEVLSLVGVLDDGARRTAFFDGSSAALRQALISGGTIAGMTLTDVTLHQATLSAGPQTFILSVGRSLAREPGGAWRAAPDTPLSVAPDSTAGAVTSPSTPSVDANEALRRLKERRRKQLKE